MKVSQTINPLHFEDLEPHRFEDMVRQLLYDYKNWNNLEASGKMGNDDGFDIRGWEAIEKDEESKEYSFFNDNLWLIQCKREKSINPKKLDDYITSLLDKHAEKLFGIIFVASCNFSDKTRRKFIEICKKYNLQQFHLLGKSELEDLLYLPKNDHLLFVYFGISLQMKQRSVKNKIRSNLILKKDIDNILKCGDRILLRDEEGFIRQNILFLRNNTEEEFNNWSISISTSEYLAYVKKNEKRELEEWDFLEKKSELESECGYKQRGDEQIKNYENKAEILTVINLPYENILAIDSQSSETTQRYEHYFSAQIYLIKSQKLIEKRLIKENEYDDNPFDWLEAEESKKVSFFKL